MFREPEDFILTALAIVWTAVAYWLASWLGMGWFDRLHVVISTGIWCVLLYIIWQLDYLRFLSPLFIGLFSICWWPVLHLFTAPDAPVPFYASWHAKIIISSGITLLAFVYWIMCKYRRSSP